MEQLSKKTDDKLKIEEWENEQDYEKVKELADRGESFEDIQSAMDKGLLLKEDAIRRQGLIERGLAAVMPKTKLESGLLSNLKSKFDPRSDKWLRICMFQGAPLPTDLKSFDNHWIYNSLN